jgi:hypothetical protein
MEQTKLNITASKIETRKNREMGTQIMDTVYRREKKWISSIDDQIPEDCAANSCVSWFLSKVDNSPAGVLRLVYDPELTLPEEYGVTLNGDLDWESIARMGRFVEIGRFAIVPEYRRFIKVALSLMWEAIEEVVDRDYTHFITDVFENEPNSPYGFHTHVLGFREIGRHRHGDLNCRCTRIILMLDILEAYESLKKSNKKFFRSMSQHVKNTLDRKLENRSCALAPV